MGGWVSGWDVQTPLPHSLDQQTERLYIWLVDIFYRTIFMRYLKGLHMYRDLNFVVQFFITEC